MLSLIFAVVEILNNFEQRAPHFHYALSLANYVAGSAWKYDFYMLLAGLKLVYSNTSNLLTLLPVFILIKVSLFTHKLFTVQLKSSVYFLTHCKCHFKKASQAKERHIFSDDILVTDAIQGL